MFERFDRAVQEKVRRAAELAEAEGASMVDVEHLLTALVDPVTDSTGRILESAGISSESISAARDREFQRALALAGVATTRPAPAGPRRLRRGRTTRFAPSTKLALRRTLEVAVGSGQGRITTESLLSGIIAADVGIIPPLLDELGTSPGQLEELLRRAR